VTDNYGRHAARTYEVVSDGDVEPKVKASVSAGAGAALVLTPFFVWVADLVFWNGDAAPDVPIPVVGAIGFVVTGVASFIAGYAARHVNRASA
jgi:drug/metabolite transporter (DMT)-like permease